MHATDILDLNSIAAYIIGISPTYASQKTLFSPVIRVMRLPNKQDLLSDVHKTLTPHYTS